MTAEQIRGWHNELGELQRVGAMMPHEVIRAQARIEIAAQLAELNLNLARMIAAGLSISLCRSNDDIPVRIVAAL